MRQVTLGYFTHIKETRQLRECVLADIKVTIGFNAT